MRQKTPAEDVRPPQWIVPGISFKNPELAVPSTKVRDVPWIMPPGWRPLSVLSEGYPNMGSESMWENKKLNARRPYWRRVFKNGNLVRMGHNHVEVPSFEEVGLGESENAKNDPAPISSRGFWGNLTSILQTAGSTYQKREALALKQKAASERARFEFESARLENSGVGKYMNYTTLAQVTGVGILGYLLLRR